MSKVFSCATGSILFRVAIDENSHLSTIVVIENLAKFGAVFPKRAIVSKHGYQ